MNIHISPLRAAAAFAIGVIWVITSILAVYGTMSMYDEFAMLTIMGALFVMGCIFTYIVLGALHSMETEGKQSRVDRMLSQLDERDLAVLRSRLGARPSRYSDYDDEPADGEYDTLESLLDQQKRKR